MVSSVNGNSLAALQAREQALANRSNGAQGPSGAHDRAAPRDPAVVYAGSSGTPSLSGVLSVQDSRNRASAISDVGVNAGQTIADLLSLAREKAAAAQTGAGDRATFQGEFQALLQTVDQMAKSASFQGVKMLDGSNEGDLQFKADVAGEATLSLTPQDFTLAGPVLDLAGGGAGDDPSALIGKLDAAIGRVADGLKQMNGQARQIQAHLAVVGRLQTALSGDGAADLDADSARLQALQVQQVLAGQGATVANQAPQALLSLFRT